MFRADRNGAARKSCRPRFLNLAAALLVLATASACDQPVREHKETIYIFGTLVEFVIRDTDPDAARAAVARIDREFQRMHRDWHAWKPGELTRVNAAFARGEPIRVSPFVLPLIRQAKQLAARSGGLFEPAIGALIGAWGFHSDEKPKGAPPPMQRIRDLAAREPRMSQVSIDGDMVSSSNRAVQLDFGGFAKGVALDRAVLMLRELGIENAIVNAGGDLNILGRAGKRPWRVGIHHPATWGLIASVDLGDDENLYTSGNYHRYLEHEGVRYSHIIDPRDGLPVRHIVSASVIHREGAIADAAATALSVAGPGDWHRVARKMGIKFALLVDDKGTIYANPAMLKRIKFAKAGQNKLIVSDPL